MKKILWVINLIVLCCLVGCSDSQKIYELNKIVNPLDIDFSTITNVQISESQAIQIDPVNYKQNASCQKGECLYLLSYRRGVNRSGYRSSITTAYSQPIVNNCYPFNSSNSSDNPCAIKDQIGYEVSLTPMSLNQNPIYVGCYLSNKCTLSTSINSQGQRILIVNINSKDYPSYNLDGLEFYNKAAEDARLNRSHFYYNIQSAILIVFFVISCIVWLFK